jgi:alpha-beta hydrolase superfamily lysophospholipase
MSGRDCPHVLALPCGLAACIAVLTVGAPARAERDAALAAFVAHYEQRLGAIDLRREPVPGGERIRLSSPLLRGQGNEPVLLLRDEPTPDVIVLTHGLSDSPYYVSAIARRFFSAGAQVVMPLLPAHGLIDPDAAMEAKDLPDQWRATEYNAVEVANLLGSRVSVGGFSTGGALSLDVAMQRPEQVQGPLFLFSAALAVGALNELAGRSLLIVPAIALAQDGVYEGVGPNPYKYPRFTQYGGLRLTEIVKDNRARFQKQGPTQPVFAVHSIHDAAAFAAGVNDLLASPGVQGVGIVVARNPAIEHASLPLEHDIELDLSVLEEGEPVPPTPRASPTFAPMMDLAITFFHRWTRGVTGPLVLPAPSGP